MPATTQAAAVERVGAPLVLSEWLVPVPSANQVVVRVEARGVCHTDLRAAQGDWPVKPTPPSIAGHEATGLVSAVGAGVTAAPEGDRVRVPWLHPACGHCECCPSAWETVCARAEFGGYSKDGGFADHVLADPNHVAHITAGLSVVEAAPPICAGTTTDKGIKVTEARPGEWLVVSGAGGLGHLAIQYGNAMGMRVCAVDVDDAKLAHATRLGADAVVDAAAEGAVESVRAAAGGGAHGVPTPAPSLDAFRQGVGTTRRRGTCVLVGLPPSEFPIPLFDVVATCLTIGGSLVGTRRDVAETLAFAAEGRVHAGVELQPLSAVNDVMARLAHGEVPSRVVPDVFAA